MLVRIVADVFRENRGYEGAIVELPANWFVLDDALQRAHILEDRSYKILDFKQCPKFLANYLTFSENKTLEEVNLLAKKVSQMNEIQLGAYKGALQCGMMKTSICQSAQKN